MTAQSILRSSVRWSSAGVGLAATTYAGYVAWTWSRYGHPSRSHGHVQDELLDRFMPVYDVVERHHIAVDAPAPLTLSVAREIDLSNSPIIRAVFKGRELILRATPDAQPRPRRLLAQVQSLGWVVLAEIADREVVVGAVTKPWEANVTFRSIASADFAPFNEPDYVKIVWTLRADATDGSSSVFRTETRAVATDAEARSKFRPYWAFLSPGIFLIRQMMLRPVKTEAERQAYLDMGPSDGDGVS